MWGLCRHQEGHSTSKCSSPFSRPNSTPMKGIRGSLKKSNSFIITTVVLKELIKTRIKGKVGLRKYWKGDSLSFIQLPWKITGSPQFTTDCLVTVQSCNGLSKGYLLSGCLPPCSDAAPPLWSRDHILGTWQLARIYACLQHPAVMWSWFITVFIGNRCLLMVSTSIVDNGFNSLPPCSLNDHNDSFNHHSKKGY